MKCTKCHAKMRQGGSALRLEEGLMGVEDFVGLDKPLIFCSEDCLAEFARRGRRKPVELKRKVP